MSGCLLQTWGADNFTRSWCPSGRRGALKGWRQKGWEQENKHLSVALYVRLSLYVCMCLCASVSACVLACVRGSGGDVVLNGRASGEGEEGRTRSEVVLGAERRIIGASSSIDRKEASFRRLCTVHYWKWKPATVCLSVQVPVCMCVSICLSVVCLSMWLFVCLSEGLSVFLLSVHVLVHMSVCIRVSRCLSVSVCIFDVCLPMWLSVCVTGCLSICVCRSACLSACLSVFLALYIYSSEAGLYVTESIESVLECRGIEKKASHSQKDSGSGLSAAAAAVGFKLVFTGTTALTAERIYIPPSPVSITNSTICVILGDLLSNRAHVLYYMY